MPIKAVISQRSGENFRALALTRSAAFLHIAAANVTMCDNDVIMCDDPVITSSAPLKAPKPATDDVDKEIADMLGLTAEQVRQIANDEITDPELKKIADMDMDKIMNLPPGKRPSPFRNGDII